MMCPPQSVNTVSTPSLSESLGHEVTAGDDAGSPLLFLASVSSAVVVLSCRAGVVMGLLRIVDSCF